MIFYPLIVIFEPNIRLEILNLDTPFTQNVHLQNDVKISFNARWTSIISHMYLSTYRVQSVFWVGFFFKRGRVHRTLVCFFGMEIHNFAPIGLKLVPYVRTDVGWYVEVTFGSLNHPRGSFDKLWKMPYLATRGHY